ncbi:MAG: hypothetical protein ACI9ZH_000031 [Paracoccaceae bacterium]
MRYPPAISNPAHRQGAGRDRGADLAPPPIAQSAGSPLGDAHCGAGEPPLEIAPKDGQVGRDVYFIRRRDGALG